MFPASLDASENNMDPTDITRLLRRSSLIRAAIWMLAATLGGYGCSDGPPSASSPVAPNVVMIVVDTLRADHMSLYGYGRATTPTLDRLAQESIVFDNASTVMSHTLPAHISLVTGVHPATHQVLSNGWTYSGPYATLAERLKARGHATAAFVSGFPLARDTGFDRGFELYDAMPRGRGGMPESKRNGEETNAQVLRWLDDQARQPFFLLVHYFDTHVPYTSPPGGETIFEVDDGLRQHMQEIGAADLVMAQVSHAPVTLDGVELSLVQAVNAYDNQIHRVDRNIGALLDALEERGLLEESLLIVLSDHGEGLGQHRYYSHGLHLYEEQLRIPLILRPPTAFDWKPGRVGAAVSLLDVVPTVLETLGLPEVGLLQGRSLGQAIAKERTTERGFVSQRRHFSSKNREKRNRFAADTTLHALRGDFPFKYLRSGEGEEELFDLSVDRGETINLAGDRPQELARMRVMLDRLLAERSKVGEVSEQDVDPEIRKALEALGYIQ